MKKLLILISLLLIAPLFTGCTDDSEVMEEELYMKVVAELAVLNQMDEGLLGDLTREEKREKIYSHFGITEEEFRHSHDYYQSDVPVQLTRMEAVASMLRAERDSIQNAERDFRNRIQELKLSEQDTTDVDIDPDEIESP